MERLSTQEETRQALAAVRRDGRTVAFVPTMGALHEGHLSLVRAARERAEHVIVSIFVNPTQFAPGEDYSGYPRDLPGDMQLLDAEGVDVVFTPSVETMYRPGSSVTVEPGSLAGVLEGAVRPEHFRGVCTIVAKLFNIVQPDLAFFGEKDFQQLVIVRRLVADLDFPVRIVGCPIVREPSGLALSSRNVYLEPEERAAAAVLYRALSRAIDLVAGGETDAEAVRAAAEAVIADEPLATLDYLAVVDPDSFENLSRLDRPARALVAARVGSARLIDNVPLVPSTR